MLFLKELQEADEFLERTMHVSSVFDQLHNKQHFFETFEVEEVKQFNNPNY